MSNELLPKSVRYYQPIKDEDCEYITPIQFKRLFPYEVIGNGEQFYIRYEQVRNMLETQTDKRIIVSNNQTYLLVMDFDKYAMAKDDEYGSLVLIKLYPRRITRPTIGDVMSEIDYMLNHWREYGVIPKSRKS